ncbi:MAG: kelch repeat-containing protein [Bacteroidota bacterium]
MGRYCAVSFTIGEKAYVGLGQLPDGTKSYDFWEYNPEINVWTKKADYPGGGSMAATGFSVNEKGYVCFGQDNSNEVHNDLWEYSPVTDTWLQKASFPGIARYGASCFVIGDTAFIGTGSHGYADDYLFDMWMYVPASDSWFRKADFPGYRRSHATAFTIGNYGYLGTGLSGYQSPSGDIWKYDKINDSWTRIPNLPGLARAAVISFVIGGKVYVGLGCSFANDFYYNYSDFYEYNPGTNTWGSLIVAPRNLLRRRYAVSFIINNMGYVGTGYSENGLLDDLWSFGPEKSSNIIEKHSPDAFNIYPNPAIKSISVECEENSIIELYSIQGQHIKTMIAEGKQATIDISGYQSGMYCIQINTAKGKITRKFVKE